MIKSDKISGLKIIYLLVVFCIVLSPFATGWWSSVCASTGPFAYIPASNNIVYVIDTSTNTVVATIPVGSAPSGVAVNPAGTRVYVANVLSDNVSVIDTSTNTVVATIAVGDAPKRVAVNPAGTRVYVVNGQSNYVSVIDTSTNTVVDGIYVGYYAEGVAVNPAGTRVYVAASRSLLVIDTSTNTIVAQVNIEDRALSGVAVNPAGTRVYVTSCYWNDVSVIDTSTNTVVNTIPVGECPIGVTFNPAGTMVYVTNYGSDDVSALGIGGATIPVGRYPRGVAVNPAGTRVYVVSESQNSVSVIDTSINTVVATIPVGGYATAFGQFIGPVLSVTTNLNAPTLSTPADGATGQATTVSVTWQDTNTSPQESSYKIRIKLNDGSYTEYSAAQNATSYSPPGLATGTKYYWSVKAVGTGTSTLDSAYPAEWSFTIAGVLLGDVNNNGIVTVADAILACQVMSSMSTTGQTIASEADVNGDGKIGSAEVIYILQKVAGIR